MILGSLVAGLLAGSVHVTAGPDHLAAVAPIVARDGRRGWIGGIRWGLGHTSGVIVVGVLALLLREALPLEQLSHFAEKIVGVVLIGIGLWALHVALKAHVHVHEHEHDGDVHSHVHVHAPGRTHADAAAPAKVHDHRHAAFGIGILHGLAGSSHFLAVLPALALPTRGDAIGYLAGFGIGTIAAMGVFARVVGEIAEQSGRKGRNVFRVMLGTCGAAAIVVGCFWIAAA